MRRSCHNTPEGGQTAAINTGVDGRTGTRTTPCKHAASGIDYCCIAYTDAPMHAANTNDQRGPDRTSQLRTSQTPWEEAGALGPTAAVVGGGCTR